MVSTLANARYTGAASVASAAMTCAVRPPPSARAIAAASKTSAAPASAGKNRKPKSESPNSARSPAAIAAIKGGWST